MADGGGGRRFHGRVSLQKFLLTRQVYHVEILTTDVVNKEDMNAKEFEFYTLGNYFYIESRVSTVSNDSAFMFLSLTSVLILDINFSARCFASSVPDGCSIIPKSNSFAS